MYVSKCNRKVIILVAIIGVAYTAVAVSVLYFLYSFFSAFSPIKISISETDISSSKELINPIVIERIRVDSVGEEGYPVRYRTEYMAMCSIQQNDGKPPIGLREISLRSPGRYIWTDEIVNVPIEHHSIYRSRVDSIDAMIWPNGKSKLEICPIKFEKNNWYFIHTHEPTLVGVYVYMDWSGKLHQFDVYSGVSPI